MKLLIPMRASLGVSYAFGYTSSWVRWERDNDIRRNDICRGCTSRLKSKHCPRLHLTNWIQLLSKQSSRLFGGEDVPFVTVDSATGDYHGWHQNGAENDEAPTGRTKQYDRKSWMPICHVA